MRRRDSKPRTPGDMHCCQKRRWYVTTSTWSVVALDDFTVELIWVSPADPGHSAALERVCSGDEL